MKIFLNNPWKTIIFFRINCFEKDALANRHLIINCILVNSLENLSDSSLVARFSLCGSSFLAALMKVNFYHLRFPNCISVGGKCIHPIKMTSAIVDYWTTEI